MMYNIRSGVFRMQINDFLSESNTHKRTHIHTHTYTHIHTQTQRKTLGMARSEIYNALQICQKCKQKYITKHL